MVSLIVPILRVTAIKLRESQKFYNVILAKAGIQLKEKSLRSKDNSPRHVKKPLDSRLRGNDEVLNLMAVGGARDG